MLVLTRKEGEFITIGEGAQTIKIYVGDISGNRVKLAIVAPAGVQILRGELERNGDGTTDRAAE